MNRRGVNRSVSTNTRIGRPVPVTRPVTAGSSSSAGQPPLPRSPRSQSPRTEDPNTPPSSEGANRRASTPEPRHTSSSSSSLTFLDDTNLSSIPSSTRAIPRGNDRNARGRLQEIKQWKKILEREALVAQMHAVLASVERYEEQEANKSAVQAKVDMLKLEMAKEEELINQYSFCIETMPLSIQAQNTVDIVKAQRDGIHGMLRGSNDGTPCSEEEISRIRDDLINLKSSLDRVRSVLIVQGISFPLGELEEALKRSAQIFQQISDYKQINRGMKNITTLVTSLDQIVLNMKKIEDLLEEKDRLTTHLASLRVSMMLYEMKTGTKKGDQ